MRTKKPNLSRESLVDLALELAEANGVEAVTLRALAHEVGVASPMALYTYFANKDDLVTAMQERALARMLGESKSYRTWQTLLIGAAKALSRSAREHANWIPLLLHTSGPPAALLGYVDRLVALMQADGFELADALRAHRAVLAFTLGGIHLERTIGGGDPMKQRLAVMHDLVTSAPKGRYESLSSVAAQIDRWSFDEPLDFGLDALVAGIEARRPIKPTRR